MSAPEEKALRRQAREAKELARLEKEKAKPKPKLYFWYLIICLCLIYIVDEVATSLPNAMAAEINAEFFVRGLGFSVAEGASRISLMEMLANICLVIGFFYKALADRFGRKPFLIFNTIGMAGALMLCVWAPNLVVYLFGFFLLRFFVTPDEQIVYIMETAPEKKRATVYSAVKGVAELGLLLIPLGRKAFMGNDETLWRMVFLIPAILGLVVAFAVLFLARETDFFLDSRIAYLKLAPAEKEKIAREKKDRKKKQGGFWNAIRYSFSDKQLRWVFLVTMFFTLSRAITSHYTEILSIANYSTDDISNALLIFPLTCAAIIFVYGFFSDRFGRKLTSIALLAISLVTLTLLVVGALFGWSAYLLGAFIGLFLGSYWSNSDTLILLCGESSPTNLRASVLSAQTAFYGIGMVASQGIASIILGQIPDNMLGLFCILMAGPFFLLSIGFLLFTVKETKGLALESPLVEENRQE